MSENEENTSLTSAGDDDAFFDRGNDGWKSRDDLLGHIRHLDRLRRILVRRLGRLTHASSSSEMLRARSRLRILVHALSKLAVARYRARAVLLQGFPVHISPGFCFTDIRDHHKQFRFSAADLHTIAAALLPPSLTSMRVVGGKLQKQCSADRLTALCVVLRHLATPERQDRQASFFGKSTSWVSQIFHTTLDILYGKALFALRRWSKDYADRVPEFCRLMEQKSSGVFFAHGLMDGSGIRVCRPSRAQHHFYNTGLETAHTLRVVALVRLDGLFERVLGPFPGSASDQSIVITENFEEELRALHERVEREHRLPRHPRILCDSGFAESHDIWTPYKVGRHMPLDEELFNTLLSHCRVPNEWAFGRVVNTFRGLLFTPAMMAEWTKPEKQYLVAIFLTNLVFCAEGSQTGAYFGVSPPSLQDYLNEMIEN